MADFEINRGGEQPDYFDPTLEAISKVLRTLGAEALTQPSSPTLEQPEQPGRSEWTPRPTRASDIRSELTPDPPTEKDINWIKSLMRDEPLVAMKTAGAEAVIPMYSTFTEEPDGELKFLFRSFESTDHASVIDTNAADGLGGTAVQLLLYRSGQLNVGLELFGYARRVPDDKREEYEAIYQGVRDRRHHNPGELWGRPDYPMYVVDRWRVVQMQTRLRDADGKHVSNGKIGIDLNALEGFANPPEERPGESDQSWR